MLFLAQLIFALPDPSTRLWRISARCSVTSCVFRAELDGNTRQTHWRISQKNLDLLANTDAAQILLHAPGEQQAEGFLRGYVSVYRRRFREVLASTQPDYEVAPDDLTAFHSPSGGTTIELILHEVEDILFAIARLREQPAKTMAPLPIMRGDRITAVDFISPEVTLPAPNTWEAQEPLLRDPAAQRTYSKLSEFYERYEKLGELLRISSTEESRIAAAITRLEILGTQAIWEVEDSRHGGVLAEVKSGIGIEPWPRERAVHIGRLALDGIRRFGAMQLDLQPPAEDGIGQWLLLLGENGSGKTTLLRAIALALIEKDIAQSFVTQFSADAPLVRMDGDPRGASGFRIAEIELYLRSELAPAHVWVTSGHEREQLDVRAAPGVRPPVFAYGCRRGNALGGPEREMDFNPLGNVATLFDPQAHLVHVETWLRKLAFAAEKDPRDRALFEAVLDLLTDRESSKDDPLLPGVREIEVTPDRTWVLGPGDRRVPLSALSDGYLTTLGWLVDFIARWLEYARRSGYEIRPGFAAEMPAVVLVDEIDLHLHPRWQMRVVPALARTFPRTTFIATTHNPLTLSGMVGDERMRGAVHIIKERADGNLEIIQRDLEPGMSADEVLTHEWFGLRSTLDRDTLELLDEHRALLRRGAPADDPRRRELEAELRRRLGSYADTPAERLAQKLVAEQFPDDVPEVDDLPDDERDRLSKLYEAAVARARNEGKSPPEQP